MKWYTKHYKDVAIKLETDLENGLGGREAEGRLELYGKNELMQKKRTSLLVRFFMQFNDFMIIVLLAAAGVSLFVTILEGEGDFADTIIILVIVTLNAILGLLQEYKAEKSIEALKKMSAPTAKVIRDGKVIVIPTNLLVPGDLVSIQTGDFITADGRLISSTNLKVEEAALTGESVGVEKDGDFVAKKEDTPIGDRLNMVYSGSVVSYGRGKFIVTETGMKTEVGKIAVMIMEEENSETPLQKRLASTGKVLGIGALIICFTIFIIGIMRQMPGFEMFMTSISLAVAAIPEGLPAIVTIMLAIGVQRMAKHNAVIRKLPAVETLGSASVICSDKTGTLTQNKMKVVEVADAISTLSVGDEQIKRILKFGCLCNDTVLDTTDGTHKVIGDPTESALVLAAASLKMDKNNLDKSNVRLGEIPFDSRRKRMSTIHKMHDETYYVIMKGAPDILLEKCNYYDDNEHIVKLSNYKRNEIAGQNMKMADKALRVIGICYKKLTEKPHKITEDVIEKDMVFLGLVGMIDPPREEVKEAVATCKKAGIKPVMVTGDHVITAMAIGRKLGIVNDTDKAMTGDELNKISQGELIKVINEYSVFARVSPEHKVRIVRAFQARGAVVAMTGDGVNDAPALKIADIGCAMGKCGTDVAKGAADMVLTDDNFATIVAAVKQGRGIYSNIRKAVHFLLSSNIGEIITIFAAILLGYKTPLLAIHLLWVNLVTDSLPAIALGVDPPEKDIMDGKPQTESYYNGEAFTEELSDKEKKVLKKNTRNESLFTGGLWQKIILEGIMVGLLSLIAYAIGTVVFDTGDSNIIGRTMCFATLSITQLVHAFNIRSEKSIFKINILENIYLVGAFFVGIAMQISVITIPAVYKVFKVTPLNATQWLIVILLCIAPVIIVEIEKSFGSGKSDKLLNSELNELHEINQLVEN